MSNQCINNIELPKEYIIKDKFVIKQLEHNTNCRPRNKVELRRKSKDVIFSEIEPFKVKKRSFDIDISSIKNKKSILDSEIKDNNNNENEIINEQIMDEIPSSIIKSPNNDSITDEITNYDVNLTIEQFEKVMNSFEIQSNCLLCKISKNNGLCQLPNNIDCYETIIFPFISKNKYGIISYVNKINISKKEKSNCLIFIKYGKIKYPSFMKKINKQLKNKLNLNNEPLISSIHIDESIESFKNNGYFILYLIECFIKKRNDDISGKSKKFNDYITLETMMESFKKYSKI